MLVSIHKLIVLIALFAFAYESYGQTWSLEQCIDSALVNNREIAMSANNSTISAERVKEVKSNLIPKLMVNGEYKYFFDLPYQLLPMSVFGGPEGQFKEAQFGVPHNISGNVQLSVPIYNPNVYGGIKMSEIAHELSTIKQEMTKENIYLEVSNLYFNAQILKNQRAFLDSNIVSSEVLLKNTIAFKGQQLATGLDEDKVRLQITLLNAQRSKVDAKYNQVLNGLKFMIGLPLDLAFDVNTSIQYSNNESKKFEETNDLLLAQIKNRLLKSELKTLKTSRLPSVAMFGSYGTVGYGYDEKPNQFLNFYPSSLAGLQIKYPLFNGTTTFRKINQKKLEIENSEILVDVVKDKNEMLIENGVLEKSSALLFVKSNQDQIELAKAIYEKTLVHHSQGLASMNDILLAETSVRETQQNYLAALVDYLRADLNLKKLTGTILN